MKRYVKSISFLIAGVIVASYVSKVIYCKILKRKYIESMNEDDWEDEDWDDEIEIDFEIQELIEILNKELEKLEEKLV